MIVALSFFFDIPSCVLQRLLNPTQNKLSSINLTYKIITNTTHTKTNMIWNSLPRHRGFNGGNQFLIGIKYCGETPISIRRAKLETLCFLAKWLSLSTWGRPGSSRRTWNHSWLWQWTCRLSICLIVTWMNLQKLKNKLMKKSMFNSISLQKLKIRNKVCHHLTLFHWK